MTRQPCKCGRHWEAVWHGSNSYTPICPGCRKIPSKCTCETLQESVRKEALDNPPPGWDWGPKGADRQQESR